MKISDKVQVTVKSGTPIAIQPKGDANQGINAKLIWKSAVDLDLYVMYELQNGKTGTVYYGSKGRKDSEPFITLDGDAGVGDTGGDNEENMDFRDMSKVKHAIIVANIFAKVSSFALYGGKVVVSSPSTAFTVPLTAIRPGSWCTLARIDNTGTETKLINVNKTQLTKPSLKKFI